MSLPLLIFVMVVAGLVIGSFLTVVVDRVPRGGSVVAPPSACGACGSRLTFLDLVPVFSFNSAGVFAGIAGSESAAAGGTGRLSRWEDLLKRARLEGFE